VRVKRFYKRAFPERNAPLLPSQVQRRLHTFPDMTMARHAPRAAVWTATLLVAAVAACSGLPSSPSSTQSRASFPPVVPAGGLPAHPRLVLTPSRIADLQAYLQNSSQAASLFAATRLQGEFYLSKRPDGPAGPDGYPNSREVLQQVYCLGLLSALEPGNASFAQRGIAEAVNAAMSVQWDLNGTIQLDAGELMHAAGIALDWFYDELTPAQRATIVNATVNLGLARVREALGPSPPSWASAFVNTSSNWNTVILGGTIVGCLAVIGEEGVPSWVEDELLPAALDNILWSVNAWGPDGAWPEGPNYGGYASRYLVPAAFSMLSATGSDGGLLSAPGVSHAPRFLLTTMARTAEVLQYFYWADTRTVPETVAQYLAIARHFNDLGAMYGVRDLVLRIPVEPNTTETQSMNAPVALLHFSDAGTWDDLNTTVPLVSRFRNVDVVNVRSSWADTDDEDPLNVFVGFKGSNITFDWAHNHLDAASFVYMARGQWWAQDLGSDNYDAPSYFWVNRFKLYRTGTIGHNTLSFDGQNQRCEITGTYSTNCSHSPIILFNVTDGVTSIGAAQNDAASELAVDVFSIVNLTDAYGYLGVGSAMRGFIVVANRTQLVTVDEASLAPTSSGQQQQQQQQPQDLWWSMHTIANVSVAANNRSATLTTWNVSAPVTVAVIDASTTCPGLGFVVTPIDLLPPLLPSPSISRVTIVALAATCSRLTVTIGVDPASDFSVNPLSQWAADGPLQQAGSRRAGAEPGEEGGWEHDKRRYFAV
jgi:hypothetical protein